MPTPRRLLARTPSRAGARRLREALRTETVGGTVLLVAAVVAVAWASSPWRAAYESLRGLTFGPAALHLRLDLASWCADGLLAVFFFVAGLELKRELVVGDLRDPARAALPVAAALCGVVVPALVYTAVVAGGDGQGLRGWAIPTATDIAFALGVLAVAGSGLPSALRSFLLTLAVVDDLVAITIIAIFYTSALDLPALLLALVPLALFGLLAQTRRGRWWSLLPLALTTWGLVHASGVHPTVAGVLLAFTVPVRRRPGEQRSPAERHEHTWRPVSAGFAVPAFALTASGVTLVGGGLGDAVRDRVALAVVAALVVGKFVGVLGGTWLVARLTRAELDDDLAWPDVVGLSLLAGIGFTVSLLVAELSFGDGTASDEHVKAGVLGGSVLSALLAVVVLRLRARTHRRTAGDEPRDGDAVTDVHRRA
ncbi:Na+/H+ antiporter NhaA [Angustibacter aerolatus]